MSAREQVDAVLATGIGLARLPALLDELEADAFRRGFDAGIEHATGFTEHQHRVVRRPDGTDGACCQPVTVLNDQGGRETFIVDERPYDARGCREGCRVHDHTDADWKLPPEPLQVDTPVFDVPEQPGLERFIARLRRNLRGEQ